ncbi:acetyltransferase [Diplodia corticola]|uniref:Acetyltransferase n=1 Tax=Diplodia corticola TaxID=236234 RepID=A0A1J9S6Y6_9PEZI|nr:acetyltransferase [Diplodia corticola]OJD36279.1 acetyltransferase [Diplodia corticola]
MSATPTSSLPPGYTFHDGPPPLETYLSLRRVSGLSPKTPAQGEGAISGSWAWCTIIYSGPPSSSTKITPGPEVVGMFRTIGDGGWYFHLADMAVLPAHRCKGLGEALLRRMLARINQSAPPGALISLLADAPARKLYKRMGFVESAPRSLGMWLETGNTSLKEAGKENRT